MYDQYILYLANFSGMILESQPQEKRLQAVGQIEIVERLYSKVSELKLSELLVRLENYKNQPHPPQERPNVRNPTYGDCFEEFIGSLPAPHRENALKKLSVIVSFFTGSCIADLLECII